MHINMYTYTRTHARTRTHTHTHTHMHACIHVSSNDILTHTHMVVQICSHIHSKRSYVVELKLIVTQRRILVHNKTIQ